MRNLIGWCGAGCLLVLLSSVAVGQQDAQYTQFVFNKLGYNPGYAGAVENPELTVIAREQWWGLDGAPSSQVASFNTAFSNLRSGFGARLNRVAVGLEEQYDVAGSYAYGVPLAAGTRLGLGLSASARYFRVNYQDARPVQGGGVDAAIPGAAASKVVPNFGVGVYVEGPQFYVGLGAPRLLQNNLDFGSAETIISREVRHYYFMAGYRVALSSQISVQPQLLVKYITRAPFDADLNVLLWFGEKLFTGAGYRLGGDGRGESASILFGATLARHLTCSFAYDLRLNELNRGQGGSIEAIVQYNFGQRGDGEFVDPRDL